MIEVKQFFLYYSAVSFIIFVFYLIVKILAIMSDGPIWVFGIHEVILVGFIGTFIPMFIVLILLPRMIIFLGGIFPLKLN